MSIRSLLRCCGICLLLGLSAHWVQAAEDKPAAAATEKKIPEISDEPKTVDPATLMPKKLAARATVDFSDSSLREVLDWLRDEQGLVVLLEKNALAEKGISLSEPLSDHLNDAPIYLLLNRLRSLGLDWYFENEILHITTAEIAEEQLQLQSYNIGDLLDAGYDEDSINETITTSVKPESWEEVGGPGVYRTLGDVVFVRQTNDIQRQVQGLLAGLRKHGRQTFTYDPPANLELQQKLTENVSVNFEDTPLVVAVEKLAADAKVDLRLDKAELREKRIRDREPVTLSLTDRDLATVLRAMLLDLKLTWVLEDGVLWITSTEKAESISKTAIYDVRDLCRDGSESDSLADAITSQAQPDAWAEVGGPGQLSFPQPGTMVIYAQDQLHQDALRLLETYRTALRSSKPRAVEAVDPQEVVTVYYRLHANVARSLSLHLHYLVEPDSWENEDHPDAPGEISLVESVPDIQGTEGKLSLAVAGPAADAARTAVISRAVLVIRQTRENHKKIAEVINRVRTGDPIGVDTQQTGFGGGGGGGFGGGYFSPALDATSNVVPKSLPQQSQPPKE
ncbi:hypothetical protein Mal52_21350 [Symmachiella dynata]|uniref:Bacterial type II/III secretion system short domain protein n=1 Tax=Symmachiella dynata TaxID=2527995 RepID=A0A517ZME9_9PLAN|nr:hypothetical protein [Symmachiella dynata]QDU43659.1 hypothetical protein Mal52_21350 [Symmachiella dynata]